MLMLMSIGNQICREATQPNAIGVKSDIDNEWHYFTIQSTTPTEIIEELWDLYDQIENMTSYESLPSHLLPYEIGPQSMNVSSLEK